MRLWMMIALSGKLVGTIGPLPYDMAECEHRLADKMAEINADDFKRELGRKNNIVMKCEYHATRPQLGTPRP